MPKFTAANDKLARLYQYLAPIDWSAMRVKENKYIRAVSSGLCPMAVRTGLYGLYTTKTANDTGLTYDYVKAVVWGAADAQVAQSRYPQDARRLRRWMLTKIRKARTGQIALPLV